MQPSKIHLWPLSRVIFLVGISICALWLSPSPAVAQEPSAAETNPPWQIHLNAYSEAPPDGRALFVSTGKTPNLCEDGEVDFTAELDALPTDFQGDYDNSEGIYTGSAPEFFNVSLSSQQATLVAKCVLPDGDVLATDPIVFTRHYYGQDDVTISTDDTLAKLRLNGASVGEGLFIVSMNANGLPKALPASMQLVGQPYSFRASNQILQSEKDMLLRMLFQETFLAGVNPLTLRIFEWEAGSDSWLEDDTPNVIDSGGPQMTNPTKRFTTYALGNAPTWHDSFTSGLGLDMESSNNIGRVSFVGLLRLVDIELQQGNITSKPYTPTLPLKRWKSISYTANVPTGTGLTVSVLSGDGEVVIGQASPGHSLADLDPTLYPSLKLRVEMTTTTATSPELFDWSLLVEPERYEIYLPLVIKA